MNITQLRSATVVVHLETPEGPASVLVDPMLSPVGELPSLKLLTRPRRRNPLVSLPPGADDELATVTHALLTHCQKGHFDHLDGVGTRWLRERRVPVLCTPHDAAYLKGLGLDARPLADGRFLGGRVTLVPCVHGRGVVGLLMEHGSGFFIELPNEPTLYLAGDTVLTDPVRTFVEERQPDVLVLPAGGARLDVGGHIIMDEEEVLEVARLSRGLVIANHLEALDHCSGSRASLRAKAAAMGLRLRVPADGERISVGAQSSAVSTGQSASGSMHG